MDEKYSVKLAELTQESEKDIKIDFLKLTEEQAGTLDAKLNKEDDFSDYKIRQRKTEAMSQEGGEKMSEVTRDNLYNFDSVLKSAGIEETQHETT